MGRLSKDLYQRSLMESLLKVHDLPKTKKEKAKEILAQLDKDPEVFKEFNTLLRNRKIKKIQNGRRKT